MLVKAGYGFYDIAAKCQRATGDVFEVSEARGKTLVDLGVCAEQPAPKAEKKPAKKSAPKKAASKK